MTSQWQPMALLREPGTKLLAWLKAHLLKTTAGVILVIAVILALFDRVAAGSLVAALFVVVALFHFLPEMESFAAFGIKARWRKQLDEAEEILEKFLLGWGSRMGGKSASKMRDVADQIDKALTNLEIDRDTLATFKRDYLFFTRYDLLETFDAIASLNIRANKLSPKPRIDLLEEPPDLGRFADQVADVDDECRRTLRVTDEAIKLLDALRPPERLLLYRRLFEREPPS